MAELPDSDEDDEALKMAELGVGSYMTRDFTIHRKVQVFYPGFLGFFYLLCFFLVCFCFYASFFT